MKQEISTPLTFLRYVLESFHIDSGYSNKKIEYMDFDIKNTTNIYFSDDKSICKVTLKTDIISKDEDIKTNISLTITGFFNIECDNMDNIYGYASNGATSILYGLIREIIYTMTAKTALPPILIPPTFFQPMKPAGEESKKEQK